MKLLLDECCDPRLARARRAAGHDVRHALESDHGTDDEAIVALAIADQRILVTEDKDFGELAVRQGRPLPGLVLLRIEPEHRHRKAERVLFLLSQHGDRLLDAHAVVDIDSVRIRRLSLVVR